MFFVRLTHRERELETNSRRCLLSVNSSVGGAFATVPKAGSGELIGGDTGENQTMRFSAKGKAKSPKPTATIISAPSFGPGSKTDRFGSEGS